jgi:hypothetical protein
MACDRLQIDEAALAYRLDVSVGALRHWQRGAPAYARLALSALISGLDPERISRLDDLRRQNFTPEMTSRARLSRAR